MHLCILMNMTTATTATHRNAAERHLARRDDLLRQARALDFRKLDRDHYDALIRSAELEHGMALSLAGEFSEAVSA